MPPAIPTLEEVLDDPSVVNDLPPSIVEEILRNLQRLVQSVAGGSDVAPTPIEMAISIPRYGWLDTPHLHYLGDQVAAAVENNGAIVVTMPPRHAKSHTCSVWTPFWFLAQRPEDQVILISYEASFARKWGIKVRSLIELYGERYGLYLDPKKTAGDDWSLTTGGGMKCVGAMGGIAGNPAKLLIADDLIKNDEEARSEIQRENLWDWWEGTVIQRIEPDTATILIGTRYNEDDLIGRVLLHSAAGDGLTFDEVTLRAKAEADDPLSRPIGKGLWLPHFSQEFYDQRELSVSPYVWHSVYQQRPTPPGGTKVDPAWWGWYYPNECPDRFDLELQSWDLALDALKRTDSQNAGLILSRKGARIFLRDGFAEHCKIAQAPLPPSGIEREKTVVGTMRSWQIQYPGAQYKLVERSLAGPMLVDTLRFEMPGMLAWPPKGQQKTGKEAMLDACVPTIRSGNVLLPLNRDGSKPRWAALLVEQCRAFGRAPYDDLVDSLTQGMSFLLPGVRAAVGQDHAAAKGYVATESPSDMHRAVVHSMIQRLAKPKLDRMKREARRQDRAPIPFGRISTGLFSREGGRRRRGAGGLG